MTENTPQILPTSVETEQPASERALQTAQTKAQVAMALSALDNRYKENLASYAKKLHACTHSIETAKIELEHLKTKRTPYLEAMQEVEKETGYELKMLERLSEQFIQKSIVIQELERELNRTENTSSSNQTVIYKKEELQTLEKEIANLELSLLEHELERQNHILALEPIEQQIRAQEQLIRKLEAQKHYIESSHLHHITQVGTQQPTAPLLDTKEEQPSQES